MTKFLSHRGSVLPLVVAGTSLAVIGVVAVSSLSPSPSSSPAPGSVSLLDVPPTNHELGVVLYTLGVDPETIAGAGLTANETTALVGNLRSYLGTHMDALRAADSSFATARANYDRLLRAVQAGLATAEDRTAWAGAPGALASVRSSRQSLRDAAFTAATDGLSAAKVSAITIARTNDAAWDLLLPHMFTSREEADWVALRDALSNQRIATKYGNQTDPAAQAIITAADAQPATALARANLEAGLPGVRSAWNSAVHPQ